MNVDEFFRRWIKGMKDLTPDQMSEARIICYGGMLIGLIIAVIQSFINKGYGFGIFLFFLGLLQLLTMYSEIKQYKVMKSVGSLDSDGEMQELLKQMEGK